MSGTSEELGLVLDTARQILSSESTDSAATWAKLVESGLTTLALPEPEGGNWLAAAAAVVRVSGELCVSGPYPDTALIALPLLAAAGLPIDEGSYAASIATGDAVVEGDDLRVELTATAVPWAAEVDNLVLVVHADGQDDVVMVVPTTQAQVESHANFAGEPRDVVRVATVVPGGSWAAAPGAARELQLRGALARALAIGGAASAAQASAIKYAGERVQFGRSISKFQVLQHSIVELAIEAEAMRAAVDVAVDLAAADGFASERTQFLVAVAKAQASAGAGIIARNAHQVHGAIGTTKEHPLHHATTRLWAWRDEFGAEREWQAELGAVALASDLWQVVT